MARRSSSLRTVGPRCNPALLTLPLITLSQTCRRRKLTLTSWIPSAGNSRATPAEESVGLPTCILRSRVRVTVLPTTGDSSSPSAPRRRVSGRRLTSSVAVINFCLRWYPLPSLEGSEAPPAFGSPYPIPERHRTHRKWQRTHCLKLAQYSFEYPSPYTPGVDGPLTSLFLAILFDLSSFPPLLTLIIHITLSPHDPHIYPLFPFTVPPPLSVSRPLCAPSLNTHFLNTLL